MIKKLDRYIVDIQSGAIPAGVHLKNAVVRFTSDLQSDKWVFDEKRIAKIIKFISRLKHFTGKHAGKRFHLQPWQLFIVANLFGFYNRDGTRRFQTCYLEMARKQGKTALVSALSLYNLVEDGEANPEILLAANSKDQARIAFNFVRNFAREYDPMQRAMKQYHSDIMLKTAPGFIKVLASDSDKLDGYDCSLGIVDEFHSAPDTKVRDVIRSSMAMRVNPLLLIITTAGFDKSLPCFELRTLCSEVIAGIKQDDTLFSVIYALDDKDDWKNEQTWLKSNPNLDITVNKEFLRTQVKQAVNNPNDEVGIKTKNLNVWCDSVTTWIPDEYMLKASRKLKMDQFKGEDCFVGVDLASNVDMTAVSYLFVKDDKYNFIIEYFIPLDTLKVQNLHADKERYREWVMHHYLKVTPGNVTDYDYITHELLKTNEVNNIVKIYYDKYNSTQWAIQCTGEGLPIEPFSQTLGNFNGCTKEFERLMLGGHIVLDDNPATRYCLRNVELKRDMHGNVKPDKSQEKKKIDGVIASLQALAAYMAMKDTGGTAIY